MTTATTLHPFEKAGLGKAPFTYAGMREIVFQAHPGAPSQAGGSCDYCGTGIRYAVFVQSADGKRFKIGMDCALKLYQESNAKADAVLVAIHDERRRMEREKRHARERRQLTEAEAFIADHQDALAELPHPYHSKPWAAGLTLADYVAWMWENAGTTGKLDAYRMAKRKIAAN